MNIFANILLALLVLSGIHLHLSQSWTPFYKADIIFHPAFGVPATLILVIHYFMRARARTHDAAPAGRGMPNIAPGAASKDTAGPLRLEAKRNYRKLNQDLSDWGFAGVDLKGKPRTAPVTVAGSIATKVDISNGKETAPVEIHTGPAGAPKNY